MKFDRLLLASTILLVAVPALTFADIKADIEASNADFVAAFNRGDAAGVAAQYMDDGQLLPPNEAVVSGRSNIEAYWKAAIGAGLTALSLTTTEVGTHGDLAYEVGEFSIDVPGSDGAKVTAKGKTLLVWKNVDGKWKVYRDMWNDNPSK